MAKSEPSVAELEGLSNADLCKRFERLYRCPPPSRMRREMLVLATAYRMQEKGRADTKSKRRLARLADELGQTGNIPTARRRPVKPGTRLVREWQGESHSITVLDEGFLYRNQQYRSLSEVARTITGTRWSGPAFFGLKDRSKR